jgi:transposase-like protein
LTPKKHEFEHDVKMDVEARVRQGIKAVLEEVLEEEMTQHLQAGYRELTPPGEESVTATTSATSLPPRARSSAWRCPETGRASS